MNNVYKSIIVETVRSAVAQSRSVSELAHAGTKGSIREALIEKLFQPMLPPDFGIASGIIVSSFGEQSTQQDIVVYHKRFIPPMLLERGVAIIPVEAAILAIEVKSLLTLEGIASSERAARELRALGMATDSIPGVTEYQASGIVSLIVAMRSDKAAGPSSESDRLQSCTADKFPHLSGICVLGLGSWWQQTKAIFDHPTQLWVNEDGSRAESTWHFVPADNEFNEMLQFLGSLLDLIDRIASDRGRPSMRRYLN